MRVDHFSPVLSRNRELERDILCALTTSRWMTILTIHASMLSHREKNASFRWQIKSSIDDLIHQKMVRAKVIDGVIYYSTLSPFDPQNQL